jgi:hypothetical protein
VRAKRIGLIIKGGKNTGKRPKNLLEAKKLASKEFGLSKSLEIDEFTP